ncbi:MAG: SpoIIE family protein phosphatase [Desulfobulbaceae bacterium]|nr:SpoIIE family protein phosphatase [Desulfobulbaceae bacterium]
MKTIEKLSILFVDDEPSVLTSLCRFLRKERYQTFFAPSGKEALEIMESREINILVTDLRMPEMSGMELISTVKSRYPDTIRVILSATRDIEQTIESINTGEVFRFISKPLDPEPFKKIIMDTVEYYLMKTEREELLKQLSTSNINLENAINKIQEVNAEKEKLAEETRSFERRIEQQLLRSDMPKEVQGATLAASSIPSGHLDGDFFDFIDFGNKQFDLVIADVMGKGVQSALVGAGIKAMILKAHAQYDCALGTRMNCPSSTADITAIINIFSQVHAMTIHKLLQLNMFVTLCYGRFNIAKKEMTFIDCGHTKTIHYRASEKKYSFLEGKNLPLGMEEQATYVTHMVPLHKDDIFLFYSDGVTEAENSKGECFGPGRLAELVADNNQLHPQELLEKVTKEVSCITGKSTFDDDFTCIAVRIQ